MILCGDVGEGKTPVIEHVLAFLQFGRVTRVKVKDFEGFFFCDLSDEVVHFFAGCFVGERNDGGENDLRGRMITPEQADQFFKIFREVLREIFASRPIVDPVADKNGIESGEFCDLPFVAARVNEPPNKFSADSGVDGVSRGEISLRREQRVEDGLKVRSFRFQLPGDAALGRAVTEEEDLMFAFVFRKQGREREGKEEGKENRFHGSERLEVNIASWSAGLYLVSIELSDGSVIYKKFVKQ